MNKVLISCLAIACVASILLPSAVAREKFYEGKCLYVKDEDRDFKSCEVDIQPETLEIKFDKEKHQDNDKSIIAKNVEEIASGEYAQKLLNDSIGISGILGGSLLAPISFAVGIFVPNRDYQQYIIQYTDSEGNYSATILNIDRSDAPEFQQELTLITGKLISFQPGQTNIKIDISPDLVLDFLQKYF